MPSTANSPVVLCVAPGRKAHNQPWDFDELREDLKECVRAGASMFHFHLGAVTHGLRDEVESLQDLVDSLRPYGVVLEGSTGVTGLEPSAEERCAVLGVEGWDLVSLNMGSTNFGEEVLYSPLAMIRQIAAKITRYGARPDLEVFEIGMVETSRRLMDEGTLERGGIFNITFGIGGTTMAASMENLLFFRDALPQPTAWGFVHHDAPDLSALIASVSLGAGVIRVGFENARRLDDSTSPDHNHEFVRRAVEILSRLNRAAASPEQTRAALGLQSSSRSRENFDSPADHRV